MTEANQVNRAVREHLGPLGRVVRVESPVAPGTPDVYYRLRRRSGWLECKVFDAPDRPRHLTQAQVEWGEAEVAQGGTWHVLGRLGREWLLFDAAGARALLTRAGLPPELRAAKEPPAPLLRLRGPFPTLALLDFLAPRDRTAGDQRIGC